MTAIISIAAHLKGPMPMACGRPILALMIERLARNRYAKGVVATTVEPIDDPIEAVARSMGTLCVRGTDGNVIEQHALAMWSAHADIVCGANATEPLLAPQLFDAMIERIRDRRTPVEYVKTHSWPVGMNAWAVTKQALIDADIEAVPDERAKVALFWDRRPTRYPMLMMARIGGADNPPFSLATDTQAGLDLTCRIFETLYPRHPDFGAEDVVLLLRDHPEWAPSLTPAGPDLAVGRSAHSAIPVGVGPAPVRVFYDTESE